MGNRFSFVGSRKPQYLSLSLFPLFLYVYAKTFYLPWHKLYFVINTNSLFLSQVPVEYKKQCDLKLLKSFSSVPLSFIGLLFWLSII